jgi:phospholipase C
MRAAWAGAVLAVAALLAVPAADGRLSAGHTGGRPPAKLASLCGQHAATRPAVRHIVMVMLENRSYDQVVGRPDAPFQNRLARQCGNAVEAFGATHGSGSNYLAISAGQYPPSSVHGCLYQACASNADNIYAQLDRAGLTWKSYQESMPYPCAKTSAYPYKIGHNPAIFYAGIPAAECRARVVPVPELDARSGPFYDDLRHAALPSLAWVTPNRINDGDGPCPHRSCTRAFVDHWLRRFVTLIAAAPAYQDGSILILVTYDEGRGWDNRIGEDCANPAADLAGLQPSCHVPLFVVWPYARPGSNGTFLTLYSVTRTVEDLFGLPCLAHACDAATASLAGSGFGF